MPIGGTPPPRRGGNQVLLMLGRGPSGHAVVDERTLALSLRITRLARSCGMNPTALADGLVQSSQRSGIALETILDAIAIQGTLRAPGNGIFFANRFGQELRIGREWQGQALEEMYRMEPENLRIVNTVRGLGSVFATQVALKKNFFATVAEPVEMLLGCEAAIMLKHDTMVVSEERFFLAGQRIEHTAELLNCLCETLLAPAMRLEREERVDSGATVLRHPVDEIDFWLNLASNAEKHWRNVTQGALARAMIFGARIRSVDFSRAEGTPEMHLSFTLVNLSGVRILEARHLVASGRHVKELLKLA